MKAEWNKIIVEKTGFGAVGAVPAFSARVWRDKPFRLEWAYGDTDLAAVANCKAAPVVINLEGVDISKTKNKL